ncbi:MAG TPA: polysaccharide biosynthesis/export family protein [Stellaceae bacterium]|nr:polysaccharide biosynthesis/export family protein [Stellaceae bacterium]
MRKLVLAAVALAAFAAYGPRAAMAAVGSDYRLGVGDELRIKVFEWRSATGDVHEWTALTGDYEISADGGVALPLLGAVKAAGQTVGQLGDAISSNLQTRLNLTIRPEASIEIIQYRPFYILGDVNKAGAYAYRPSLTVLQAISLAGGRYRVNDPALLLTTTGNLRVLRLQYNQLLARRARLQAELAEANTVAFPPELQRQQSDPNVAQLMQREQALFTTRRDALHAETDALNQLKSLLSGEVASLQDKMKNADQELALLKQELSSTTSLVQRGLAVAPREYEMRQSQFETLGRRLDLDTAALRAKEDIGKADQSIIELRDKTRNQTQADLADVEEKIPETAAQIAASASIVDHERGTGGADAAATAEDPPALCLILRPSDSGTQQIQTDETAEIEPGDTIKVLRANDASPLPKPNPEIAADPPRLTAPPRPAAPRNDTASGARSR